MKLHFMLCYKLAKTRGVLVTLSLLRGLSAVGWQMRRTVYCSYCVLLVAGCWLLVVFSFVKQRMGSLGGRGMRRSCRFFVFFVSQDLLAESIRRHWRAGLECVVGDGGNGGLWADHMNAFGVDVALRCGIVAFSIRFVGWMPQLGR